MSVAPFWLCSMEANFVKKRTSTLQQPVAEEEIIMLGLTLKL
jgi:hypothetical protein